MSNHYKLFSYNFEKASAKDIIEFVQALGHRVDYLEAQGFRIENSGIYVRLPNLNLIFSSNFDLSASKSGSVLFEMYDAAYYPQKEECMKKMPPSFGQRNEDLLKQHEKLFNQLKKRFQMRKDEMPKAVKDLEWIKKIS